MRKERTFIDSKFNKPKEWNPESVKLLRQIASSPSSPLEKKAALIAAIRKQKPINDHILHTIPNDMQGIWSEDFIQQFLNDFGKGAPTPPGFDKLTARGTPSWDRGKLELSFMVIKMSIVFMNERKISTDENFELVHRDRCKNSFRKLATEARALLYSSWSWPSV